MLHLTPPKSSLFLAIPKEIRQQIYGLCIPLNFRVLVRQDMCSMVCGEGDGFQSEQETHGTQDVPEESDIVEADDGSLPGSPALSGLGASSSRRDALPGLLLVCRQITNEVKAISRICETATRYLGGRSIFTEGAIGMTMMGRLAAETSSMIVTMTIITRTNVLLFPYNSGKTGRYPMQCK
jgi:hypothetical protein